MDGGMDGWMGAGMGIWVDGGGCMYKWMDGWVDGRLGGWMDIWVDGGMDGWMNK